VQSKVGDSVISGLLAQAKSDSIQKVCVGAIIQHGGKFLLIERAQHDFMGGLWEIPSGGIEPGEDLLGALAREVYEETALVVTAVTAYAGSFDYTSGSGKTARQLNFLVDVGPGNVRLNPEEHSSHCWASLGSEDFSKLNVSGEVRSTLESLA
jgi:8-oxo-dGTP diphosphatase